MDLINVSQVARRMIRDWGMGSFKFNIDVAYGDYENRYRSGNGSPETSREVELEIKALVDNCLENVRKLIVTHRSELDQIARALLEKETLVYKDIVGILEPQKTEEEIDREVKELAERQLVGKLPLLNLEAIRNLPSPDRRRGQNKNGNGNGKGHSNGNGHANGHGEGDEPKAKGETEEGKQEKPSEGGADGGTKPGATN
jgi:hypothetical protein